jgi:hypothetical protein
MTSTGVVSGAKVSSAKHASGRRLRWTGPQPVEALASSSVEGCADRQPSKHPTTRGSSLRPAAATTTGCPCSDTQTKESGSVELNATLLTVQSRDEFTLLSVGTMPRAVVRTS